MTSWVLLRGLAREARHWNGFGAALQRRLPNGDTVLAPDLPGSGRRCAERSPATIPATAADVREWVRTSRHAPPYVLVALSMGGMVAVQWALEWPDELAGCVLINSSAGGISPPWHRLKPAALLELLAALAPQAPRMRERRIAALTTNLRSDVQELAARWAEFAKEAPVTASNAVRQLVAAQRFRAPRGWPQVPALVLAAAADRVVSPFCSIGIAQRWCVPLRLHASAGHDLPVDDAQWVIAQISAWWSEQLGDRAA